MFKQIKNKSILLVFTVMLLLVSGCDTLPQVGELQDKQFNINIIDEMELYFRYPLGNYIGVDPYNFTADEEGVIISRYLYLDYYNPVAIATRGLNFFDHYINMPDSIQFLNTALKHRDALIGLMDEDGLLEYRMNYVHFDIYHSNPWYSGMAQGLALSLFSFLSYYLEDSSSTPLADKMFETLNPYSSLSKEIVCIDSAKFAWIEEYPGTPPDHTFNGFMYALIGLYDYYRLVNDSENVRNVLSVYLTTINNNMYSFRNPEGISYYCLRHKHTNPVYHKIHIRQLDYFTTLTDDPAFSIFADTLVSDYWNY